jgi:ribonucleoside-diphosphate reductase alpha chain
MSTRKRLPNRRGNVSFGFEFEGHRYRATAGYFEDGRLAEIFMSVPGRAGTPLESNADTAAILTSLLLQHGVSPESIRHSIAGPVAIALAEFSGGA